MTMGPVGEKHENLFFYRIYPQARSRKTVVPEALGRHFSPGGRALRRGSVKGETPVLVHSHCEIGAKKLAGFRLEKPRVIRQELLCDLEHFFCGREQPGMARDPAHEISIPVMDLAPDQMIAEKRVSLTCGSGWFLWKITELDTRLLLVFISVFARSDLASKRA